MEQITSAVVLARVEQARIVAGLSFENLATRSGIAVVTLHRRLRGDENATLAELVRLSGALETPLWVWALPSHLAADSISKLPQHPSESAVA